MTPSLTTTPGPSTPGRATPGPSTRTVAVLGPRDSAAQHVAEALSTALAADPRDAGGAGIRILVDARPEDRPDLAILVVDAVCPIRPDDVEVARGVAARAPLVVAIAAPADDRAPDRLAGIVDVTTSRLVAAGVRAPVHVVDERSPGGSSALLAALRSPAPSAAVLAPGSGRSDTHSVDISTVDTTAVDWLLARRTEAITARSYSLRQDVQALRIDLVQDLHRALRDLGARTREEIGAAPRGRVRELVRMLSDDADAAVTGVTARADQLVDSLVSRHLGAAAPASPHIEAPTGGIRLGRVPHHRGEEVLVLVMGAAGGTGVGRMILAPLADMPALSAALLPLALLAGLGLGVTTLGVRRTQALRAHTIAGVTDRLAGLRAEVEQMLGSRVLAAEATITDGFAHDPGPRVADLERRIRRLRQRATASTWSDSP